MNKKLVTLFILIIVLPLAMISWLGVGHLKGQQEVFANKYKGLLENQLMDISKDIEKLISRRESKLIKLIENNSGGPLQMQALVRQEPLILQAFKTDSDKQLIYPDTAKPLSAIEKEFLIRTSIIFKNKSYLNNVPGKDLSPKIKIRDNLSSVKGQSRETGWTPWFWEEGIHLLFWIVNKDKSVSGCEVERIVLVSELIAELPEGISEKGRYVIFDSRDRPVYQWGAHEPDDLEKPITSVQLPLPFNTWSIKYFGSESGFGTSLVKYQSLSLGFTLGILILIIIGIAVYIFKESSRHLRDAALRVNFVNQVSHELKTPLTNIRLYSELLRDKVDEYEDSQDGGTMKSELDIILSESQRLTRLINNILTFSKKQKSGLKLHKSENVIDRLIENVIEQYKLSLAKRGILEIKLDLNAVEIFKFDSDAFGQIIANLISNVEKYATRGSYLSISTKQTDTVVTIDVNDHGPGIPEEQREKIFMPYHRVNDLISEGVSGTGIGLAIARDLSRLHGGDLTYVPLEKGSCFRITLPKS